MERALLYLYAIIDRPRAQIALPRGVEDATPEILAFDEFSVVASSLGNAPQRDNAAIRSHMNVLSALMPQCTVLPVRFGTVFPAFDDLSRSVSDMRSGLLADLLRLQGQLELSVCVTARGTPPLPTTAPDGVDADQASDFVPGPGFRYIAGKRREHDERLCERRAKEVLAERVCAPFATIASEQVWHALPSSAGRGISAAFLVRRERFAAFQLTVARLRRTEPDLDILCTGPWPPFTFVGNGARTFTEGAAHAAIASRIPY